MSFDDLMKRAKEDAERMERITQETGQAERLAKEAERSLEPFREFHRSWGNSILQQLQGMPSFLNSVNSLLADLRLRPDGLQSALDQFAQFKMHSPPMEILSSANTIFSSIALKEIELERETRQATFAAAASIIAQERLLHVPWDSIGSLTRIDPSEFLGMKDCFTGLTQSYRSLARSFEEKEIASFPSVVSSGPSLEILASVRVMESISPRVDGERSEECGPGFEGEIEGDIEGLIEAFNPGLRTALLGAKKALRSDNPDRCRHVTISCREAVTHTLHGLAPDRSVRSWTNDPSHFHVGRPTRAARVLYICRSINHGPFSAFMDADVRAQVEFIDLFQKGTHSLDAPFTDEQLRALIIRTESLIRFLIQASKENH